MVNSLFDPDEVTSERTVIISERQGGENEPLFRLGEEIQAAAFRVHAYHHQVIGDLVDLQSMGRNDLYNHYRTYYVPNNAVLAVAGDFETEEMLVHIRQLYEPIPSGDDPRRIVRPEPTQRGERRVNVEGPGETTYIQAAYHAPAATHPDFFPLMVMDSLLTGPSNLNMFGGGISNKTSRLYQALVEEERAISISGGLSATIDPFLYNFTCILHPEKKTDAVVAVLDEEFTRLQNELPREDELARAVKQARALFAYGSERITNQAFWLGFAEMFDTYDWFLDYVEKLAAVTPQEVQRVAQTYLRPQNRVLGVYWPTGNGEAAA
jgi:zinc protease